MSNRTDRSGATVALRRARIARGIWAASAVALILAPAPVTGAANTTAAAPRKEPSRLQRADTSSYLNALRGLRPGDTLVLAPGIYDKPDNVPGLPIFNLHGEPGRPIIITGPATGPRPVFRARPTHNTVRIANASHIIIRNLELDGRDHAVDAVKAQGISHDITLENLLIRNHGSDQQNVGISTKAPAWNWIIRGNTILGAGTGMYLGFPDGSAPFVGGLIEHNLIVDTLGYNVQIKHQGRRPDDLGMPAGTHATVIRHNVFGKGKNAAHGRMARPNLLVGHFPPNGSGTDDLYEIYNNFFYQNESGECLFQGEGNIAFYNNLLVNEHGDAVCIQPHKDVPRSVRIFHNTVLARDAGIKVHGGHPRFSQEVIGNAVFADSPIRAAQQRANVTDKYAAATRYLKQPVGAPGELDLTPRPNALSGSLIDLAGFRSFLDSSQDFNGNLRDGRLRGAYATDAINSGWVPALEKIPARSHASPTDSKAVTPDTRAE